MADATKYPDGEDIDADAELAASSEHPDGEDVDADADMAGATEHAKAAGKSHSPSILHERLIPDG